MKRMKTRPRRVVKDMTHRLVARLQTNIAELLNELTKLVPALRANHADPGVFPARAILLLRPRGGNRLTVDLGCSWGRTQKPMIVLAQTNLSLVLALLLDQSHE